MAVAEGVAHSLVERHDGLVTVTFNRPHRKNALTARNWADLDDVLVEMERDPADRALVITGAGGNFSSGADLSGGLGLGGGGAETDRTRRPIIEELRAVDRTIARLARLPKPTVAAVDRPRSEQTREARPARSTS